MRKKLTISIFVFIVLFLPKIVGAYGDCSSYGMWAISDGFGYCSCMTGYVWGTDFLGNKVCVSGDSKCKEQYGVMSTYDSLSGKCECQYGYLFGEDSIGRTQCISYNSYCKDRLGFNSRYNSLTDNCECNYGYELSYKTFGSGYECKRCSTKYGIHSSYNSLLKKCECDNGYTLKDGRCVEKHNSAYFKLKEVNTDNEEAIVKSNYTGNCYYISYGAGCYSSTIRRYINDDVVINMGTDLYVDVWDWLVLQDDDETCSLTEVENVDCDFTFKESDTSFPTYNYQGSCGNNSKLIADNKCQCNFGYQWVDHDDPNNLDCEKIVINTTPQIIINNTSDNITNFIKTEKEKLKDIDINLTNRLKGKILLQIENKGQAWYINPENGKRYYMADGNEAYRIMRELGVGINNADLEKIKTDTNFAKKHSGKIFLQVENHGEAYYIDFDGNNHYLKNGNEAYNIMRDLGLGIINNDIQKIDIS